MRSLFLPFIYGLKLLKRIVNIVKRFIILMIEISLEKYFTSCKPHYGLNTKQRKQQIIVSLTSYPARFETLHICIKTLLCQTMKPDKIILTLARDEATEIPDTVMQLSEYGLQIEYTDLNLKPHNKYIAVMEKYPQDLIITVDDDLLYDKALVKDLYQSYMAYPHAISARRVHKMVKNIETNTIMSYNLWKHNYTKITVPSFELFATGAGGVLYPPRSMDPEVFNTDMIQKLCLNADDVWLKFMQLKKHTPVVWVPHRPVHPYAIDSTRKAGLANANVALSQNDMYIKQLEAHYDICLSDFIKN